MRPSAPIFDVAAALALLSRLPLPIDHGAAGERGARAAWAYPVAGLILGGLAGAALWALLAAGVAPGPAAAAALGVSLFLTGALHEDGLADAADGLGAAADRARALEIMRDSQIGAFGAAALGVSLLARWSAVAALAEADPLAGAFALTASGAVSRALMTAGLALWPSARPEGLAASQGAAPLWTLATALTLAGCAAAALAAVGTSLAVVAAALVAALSAGGLLLRYAGRRLGGQTGDTLGAAQQMAESTFLAALTAGA